MPAGSIVGNYRDNAGVFHGPLWEDREFSSIDFPGARFTRAFGINARGDIVGQYVDASNRTHGFVATLHGEAQPGLNRTDDSGRFLNPAILVLTRLVRSGWGEGHVAELEKSRLQAVRLVRYQERHEKESFLVYCYLRRPLESRSISMR